MDAWHRTTDIDDVWFVQNLATGQRQTWRATLTDAKAAAEFIAGGAA